VALVDVRLGTESGIDLLRALHARHPDLIAVMMTAYASIEATVGALQAGAYDYLRKPFHADELLATLARCLERRRLHEERERAVAALQARNRELEALNARLARVPTRLGELSRARTPAEVEHGLLEAVVDELGARGGAFYLREGQTLRRQAQSHPEGHAPLLPWPLPPPPAGGEGEISTLVLPVGDDDGAGGVIGIVVVAREGAEPGFTRQDAKVGQILTSFGAEVLRAARAGDGLARSEERLRQIVENAPFAIALKDLQGSHLLANHRFVEWFGPGGGGTADEAAAIRLGRAVTGELEVAPARRLLVTRFPVRDGAGRPVGVGTIGTDVTERHEAEERLRLAQRMEAVGQLTGGVAHDFNNLLAVVLGNLRLIEEECRRDRPDLLEMIADALDATRSGVELTGRLLAFGRGQPLQPELTDVREQVLSVSRLLGRTLGERITIRLTLAPDSGQVSVDRSQLEASLLNLALNARDAMPEGGELAIAVRNELLPPPLGPEAAGAADPEARPGRYVALSVADTGHGMSAAVRQRAVQPFFTTKPAGAGSGLGLSMAYGFVRQSGGHLRIASEPGRGTVVTLYFPLVEPSLAEAEMPRPLAAPVPTGRGERVLLVEDQPRVRLLLKRQLTRLGYAVVDVADARAALVRFAEEGPPVDLLLTDIVLPGETNGVQLGEAALARDPTLALLLTTGYAAESLAGRTGPIAAARILRKPVDPDTLARALRQELDRRRAAQAAGGANT
jgi:signal transduction histidine kinase/FixJ family two-component response regulator